MWLSLLRNWSKREERRERERSLGATNVFSFVDDVVACSSPHCDTRFESTAAASESSASTTHGSGSILAKWTTLAHFRAARDIAFDVSDALRLCPALFNAALRVWSIATTFEACTVQVTL